MTEKILFEIKQEHLETGLRGFPVGYCVTSTVDPERGLFYTEKPVSEVGLWEPERVIFLLYHGYDGSDEELAIFREEIKKRSLMPKEVLNAIYHLPREGHPMALYSAAVLILGMFVKTGDYREDCLNLIAKIPEVTAAVINHHAGWGATPASQLNLGYMENFSQMLLIPNRTQKLPKVLTLFNTLHYDHGGGNLSTFVGKAVASGLADLYSSIASALNALSGPRHGGANQQCLYFVQEIMETVGENANELDVERLIRDKLARKELIYGFGHAVLRVEDPRATVLYETAKDYYSDHPLVKVALLIRKAGVKVLKENPKIGDPFPNVDAISGTLLTAAGFPYPEYYTVLLDYLALLGLRSKLFTRGF